ncbi:uncharacterized protein ARMOST_18854 [Armillaria ostoyae]|uniref:Uncharacterized protein n=1 Tax=Armillaria ostoyae TaxID=47428 RepID=A0A284S2W7_ARMOS|nr:uncharacterized protein ARMOST_18854 [Armillaria ostoyae]
MDPVEMQMQQTVMRVPIAKPDIRISRVRRRRKGAVLLPSK